MLHFRQAQFYLVASIKRSNYINKKLAEELVRVHFKGFLCS